MTKKLFFFIVFCFSTQSFSSSLPGAVSTATGGTGRGTAEPVDSVLLNPAMVSQLTSKFFSFNYTKEQWGITIADNGKEVLFPAALAFVRSETDALNTQRVAVAVSYPIFGKLSMGANISLLEYSQPQKQTDQKYRQTTGDIGLAYISDSAARNTFGLGLVANKVFSSNTDLNDTLEVQKTFGFGANYTYMNFIRFRFDTESAPENKTDRLVYMGGLETFMNDWVVVRLGYQNNNVVKKNFVTAGLGFAGPQFGLHYGYISNVADQADDKHSIDLGIPF